MSDTPDGYVDRQEAAAILRIHPVTVSRWVRAGKLTPFVRPAWRARRKYYFQTAVVQKMAADMRVLRS